MLRGEGSDARLLVFELVLECTDAMLRILQLSLARLHLRLELHHLGRLGLDELSLLADAHLHRHKLGAHLAPIRELLYGRKAAEHAVLVRRLAERRHRELLRSWRRELETPAGVAPTGAAARPVLASAGRRIVRRHRRLLRRGAGVGADSPAEDLHRVRKDAKELRYLLEFFRPVLPEGSAAAAIRSLKDLQDLLGLSDWQPAFAPPLTTLGPELIRAAERFGLSARGYHRVLRVARTIADLAGERRTGPAAVAEALSFRGDSLRGGI